MMSAHSNLHNIVVLGGPTGVGKTAFSMALAHALDAEILSVDSLQVYRHLDIGTAKATLQERAQVPHHLIDILNPDQDFNVAQFMDAARAAIDDIRSRGKQVIAVGGSNLYIRALVHGIFEAPPPDEAIRARHKELANYYGVIWLYRELQRVDPVLAGRIHSNDLIRISRGLEIYEQTGQKLSALQGAHKFAVPNYRALKLILNRQREDLYERINARVDGMIRAGLIDEYTNILGLGFTPNLKPLMSVGYRHAGEFISGNWDEETMLTNLKQDTRRFAKQQLSWLRSEPQTRWMLAADFQSDTIPTRVLDDVRAFLEGHEPHLDWTKADDPFIK